jgi:transaldolase
MNMNPIEKLHSLGQSIWYDNIERKLLINGDLAGMVAGGKIRGITSNPSIFKNAISSSSDYDTALFPLAREGKTAQEIYEFLAVDDIKTACDLFFPLYEQTLGGDGFVSLEVDPFLAKNPEATLEEALRLWKLVNRPNLMIKIPATLEGLSAITQTIASGINVNVTLIFSVDRYLEVMEAYIEGLEIRFNAGKGINKIASVASFFVSRIDSKIDNRLMLMVSDGKIAKESAERLLGKVAVANAKLAFELHKKIFFGERFAEMDKGGGQIQRVLWASTSTKNPAYPDTKYVDELIGPNTINTIPPNTLQAFGNHGRPTLTLETGIQAARQTMDDLESLGISMKTITAELEEEGVRSFADAFSSLLETINRRRMSTPSK